MIRTPRKYKNWGRQTNNHGGLRHKLTLAYGNQVLLAVLWDKHGGPTEVAKKVSIHTEYPVNRQGPISWRNQGYIPTHLVKGVAEALGINPAGLNYLTLAQLMPSMSWEKIVKSYDLPPEQIKEILALPVAEYKGHG